MHQRKQVLARGPVQGGGGRRPEARKMRRLELTVPSLVCQAKEAVCTVSYSQQRSINKFKQGSMFIIKFEKEHSQQVQIRLNESRRGEVIARAKRVTAETERNRYERFRRDLSLTVQTSSPLNHESKNVTGGSLLILSSLLQASGSSTVKRGDTRLDSRTIRFLQNQNQKQALLLVSSLPFPVFQKLLQY